MKDLSSGPIPRHIAMMSIQMGIGLVVQVAYFAADLAFVSRLNDQAIAGFTSAGNIWFVVLALTQILSVGTIAMVSHAVGAQQRDRANLVFNQSLLMSLVIGAVVFAGVYLVAGPYMRFVAADDATARAGIDYLYWFAPGLALQFPMVAMFATLRATGIMLPTMILQMVTVVINIFLAAVLTIGWLTGHAFGTAGAGMASSLAIGIGIILSAYYFHSHEKYVAVHREQLRAQLAIWWRLFLIGLPVGLEFLLMSLVMAIIYIVIRDFGSEAQAGFGVAQGVIRIIMLPAMAVAFAAAPIAGQNFGARRPERVRETFRWTLVISVVIMFMLTLLCQFAAPFFIHLFTNEAAVVAVGVQVLMITSWNFAANGVIFSSSSMFQALGNTWPTIVSSAVRVTIFAVPAIWLSTRAGFQLVDVWYVSLASMFIQAGISYLLVRREFSRRLAPLAAPATRAA